MQRFPKAVDMMLTARLMNAVEAGRACLVSRVVAQDQLMETALDAARAICAMSLPSILMTKECVNRSYETPLADGTRYERQSFHSLFATHDQKEGMSPFLEKRLSVFKNC